MQYPSSGEAFLCYSYFMIHLGFDAVPTRVQFHKIKESLIKAVAQRALISHVGALFQHLSKVNFYSSRIVSFLRTISIRIITSARTRTGSLTLPVFSAISLKSKL